MSLVSSRTKASSGQGIAGQADHGRPLQARLRAAGLRPTRQRLALGNILFGAGDRHVTAEALFGEAQAAGEALSLATVYNTLNQFVTAGLLRQVTVDGARTWFDTNTGDHHHFYFEDEGRLADIPGAGIAISGLPETPEGTLVQRVDVIVRVARAG